MTYGLPQSMMYNMRGNLSDGLPVRNRSMEQYSTPSGNPGLPIFNVSPQAGQPQQIQYQSPMPQLQGLPPMRQGSMPAQGFGRFAGIVARGRDPGTGSLPVAPTMPQFQGGIAPQPSTMPAKPMSQQALLLQSLARIHQGLPG